jgi:hypothetical protein
MKIKQWWNETKSKMIDEMNFFCISLSIRLMKERESIIIFFDKSFFTRWRKKNMWMIFIYDSIVFFLFFVFFARFHFSIFIWHSSMLRSIFAHSTHILNIFFTQHDFLFRMQKLQIFLINFCFARIFVFVVRCVLRSINLFFLIWLLLTVLS